MTDEKHPTYHLLLTHEQDFGRIVTGQVLEKPTISFWMILVPILLLPYMYRVKKANQAAEIFTEGYLFTKRLALDAAYTMYTEGHSLDQAMLPAIAAIQRNPEAKEHIREIYRKQASEVELLANHYYRLFTAQGDTFEQLILSAYQTAASYEAFLDELAQAEQAVNEAAMHAVSSNQSDLPEIVRKIENQSINLRQEKASLIFTSM